MKFQPGVSGNPGGRTRADREMQELARDASPRAIGRLVELMECDQGRVAVAACTAILDRAFGKPTQPISGDDEKPPIQLETPSVEALAALAPEERATIRAILAKAMTPDVRAA